MRKERGEVCMYKVLLADDEPYVIEGLELMIEWNSRGFEIAGRAQSGIEALELYKELKPDLLVLDINMPGKDGLEVIEEVKKDGFDGEIMILSGYAEVDYARRAMRRGVKYFINKPVDTEEMYDALESAKRSLEKRRTLKGAIDRNEALETAKRRMIASGRHPDYEVTGVLILYIGSRDIDEGVFPKNVYVRDRFAGWLSLIVCTPGDFDTVTEELFERIKKRDYGDIAGVRRGLGSDSIEVCAEKAMLSLRSITQFEPGRLYDSKERGTLKISPIMIADYADRVVGKTELCDAKGAKEEALELFSMIEKSDDPPSYGLIFSSYLLVRINKLIIENGGASYDPEKLKFWIGNTRMIGIYHCFELVKELCGTAIMTIEQHKLETEGESFSIVEKYIKEHFREQIVIQDIAKKLYTSPGYLGMVFTKKMGISIKEYLHTLRMEEAVRLMTETDMSLSEIAYSVGYNNYNNFYHHFERFFCMTPKMYKEAL